MAAGSTIRLKVEGIAPLAPLAVLSGRLNGDPLNLFEKIVIPYKETLDALVRVPPDAERAERTSFSPSSGSRVASQATRKDP